jgi:urocanate hydratase
VGTLPFVFQPGQPTSNHEDLESLPIEACRLYFALIRKAQDAGATAPGDEPSLGGKLFYAGELDDLGRTMALAANVAGCATLAATADLAAQKQAIHDGVVDFLVTSLDEALRILKNEIRQRKTVAVCVGIAPDSVEREMLERGVQPDLVFTGSRDLRRNIRDFGADALEVGLGDPDLSRAWLTWQVDQAPARCMPKLDAAALDCINPKSWEARWIRLSPRYLGRSSFGKRALFCDQHLAKSIIRKFAESLRKGEVGAEVSANIVFEQESATFHMRPGEDLQPDL